ncbi:RAG1-ACTIVATING PROTEIN 1 [Salix viminalis]|uniref:Bidirectional sugar transporter SWEET n=1 Tax=Salix viminalis TaxID=40686 RepID=A0A9Q0U754_SALVM|nr:RAG1-ACTIVATING PROTEIN 1 [Salix viminalis]
MNDSISNPVWTTCKDAAGIAGNIFAFGLFVSPIPTYRRIIRNRSTEQFSGLPYIYALMNCLICMWYGTPLVSADNLLLVTVNSFGAVFQLAYTILFIIYAERRIKVRTLVLLLAVLSLFAIIAVGSLQISDRMIRWILVGSLTVVSLISMFASPLFIINLVIQTKSVEFMPFYLSLSTFLMSTSFLLYGLLNFDAFVYVPNGIGTILGIIQLTLYFHYKKKSTQDSMEPLIVSHA